MDLTHIVYALLGLFGLFNIFKFLSEFFLELWGYTVTPTRWWQKIDAKKKEKK